MCSNYYAQSPMNFNQNFGGYPYGYPPIMPVPTNPIQQAYSNPYSPFIDASQVQSSQEERPYVPQMTPEMAARMSGVPYQINPQNREVELVNPSSAQTVSTGYIQGGVAINPGGYNPVTMMQSQPTASPVMLPSYNPAAAQSNPYCAFQQNPAFQGKELYKPSSLQPNAQYMTPYMTYNYQGYAQNSYDQALQDLMYEETDSGFDVMGMLEHIVLTDAEREKIDHRRNYVVSYDYYGRPIYQNSYQESMRKQNEFEEARRKYQEHFTMLSKIAHAYSGEEIDEESAMKHFDPVPKPQVRPHTNNDMIYVNPATATQVEMNHYYRDYRFYETQKLAMQLDYIEANKASRENMRNYYFSQIKESHDKLLGIEPGQHYDLKTYLDNGYKIGVQMAIRKSKSANRNGTTKYSRNGFRASLSQRSRATVPITSKDDDYVSIEDMIKNIYDRNKVQNNILQMENGQTSYTTIPSNVSPAESAAHNAFMKQISYQKEKDDARKAARNYG